MDVPLLIVFGLMLAFTVAYGYAPWFQPGKYGERSRKLRQRYRQTLPFMPQVMLFEFYDRHPRFELVIVRVASLFLATLSIVGMVVAVLGLFGGR